MSEFCKIKCAQKNKCGRQLWDTEFFFFFFSLSLLQCTLLKLLMLIDHIFTQGGYSNKLVYTCMNKKQVKRGLFCSRTRKAGNMFRGLKCHVSGKTGLFCQNLLKFFRLKPIWGSSWDKIPGQNPTKTLFRGWILHFNQNVFRDTFENLCSCICVHLHNIWVPPPPGHIYLSLSLWGGGPFCFFDYSKLSLFIRFLLSWYNDVNSYITMCKLKCLTRFYLLIVALSMFCSIYQYKLCKNKKYIIVRKWPKYFISFEQTCNLNLYSVYLMH